MRTTRTMKTTKKTMGILTAGTLALATAAALPVLAQEPAPKPEANVATTPPRLAAADKWRALRVGLFIHWGPSSGRALPQSHSHARKSALNPHGSVPAEVYDQFYREGEWQSVLKHTGTLGGPPILDFQPVRARFVRLEFGTFRPHPLEVSELRLFGPLEPLER